jgi:coproporphyrinogen III oxidase
MNVIYFDAAAHLNGVDNRLEQSELDTENGNWDTQVARGPVIEKAGRTITVIKKPTFQAETLWSRYLVLAAHPKSPLVGTMQASFVVEFHKDGNSMVAGMIDVMPAATSDEDLAEIKSAVEVVYQAHGVDGAKYRQRSCVASAEERNVEHRRKAACVGGNFFGRNPMAVTEENFEFMTEIYQTFVESFLAIVEKRRNDAYTEADLALQDEMRRGWLEDRMFADPNTTQFAPWEAWSLYSLPPVVKF